MAIEVDAGKIETICYGGSSDIDMSAYVTLSGSTPTVVKSKNLSSLTDRGTGQFTAIPTTNLASTNYVLSGSAGSYRKVSEDSAVARSVSAVPLMISTGGTLTDLDFSFMVTEA